MKKYRLVFEKPVGHVDLKYVTCLETEFKHNNYPIDFDSLFEEFSIAYLDNVKYFFMGTWRDVSDIQEVT